MKIKINKTHPGLPNYTGPTKGWFLFVHHEEPLEWSDNIVERVNYINKRKVCSEIPIRFQALQHISASKIPNNLHAAWQACDTAWHAYNTAWQAYNTARQACDTARHAYNKARQAYNKARQAYSTVWLKKVAPKTDWVKLWDAKNKTLIFPTEE